MSGFLGLAALVFCIVCQVLWWAGLFFLARDRILRAWWPRFGLFYPGGMTVGIGSWLVLFLAFPAARDGSALLFLLVVLGSITVLLHILCLPDVFRGLPFEDFSVVLPIGGQEDPRDRILEAMDKHGWILSRVNRRIKGRLVWLFDKDYSVPVRSLGIEPSRGGPRQFDISMIAVLDGLVRETDILLRCYVFPPVLKVGKVRALTHEYLVRATTQVKEILEPLEGEELAGGETPEQGAGSQCPR